MRVLLLSAYDAHSHRRWREGLVAAFPEWEWTLLTLPPRNFAWRIRGNSLSWAFGERTLLERRYDLLVTTSMTDLSTLRGLVPALTRLPTLVYCHENQFAYPQGGQQQVRVESMMVNLYTLLAADRVVFNSGWNRDSCLDGIQGLLAKMPDAVPSGVVAHITARSRVLPVPLETDWFAAGARIASGEPLKIVWNHRWEYDKGPERLFAALLQLRQAGVDFRVHVVGQQFRKQPAVFAELHARLGVHIGAWGMLQDVADYRRLLQQSDIVLSTALHEFQGLAIQEAVASGCVPLVPDRLAYVEYFAAPYRYPSYIDDPEREGEAIATRILQWCGGEGSQGLPPLPDLSGLSWARQKPAYAVELDMLARSNQS
jgi:glycosyltransferase involved in cell wall biosynthesis